MDKKSWFPRASAYFPGCLVSTGQNIVKAIHPLEAKMNLFHNLAASLFSALRGAILPLCLPPARGLQVGVIALVLSASLLMSADTEFERAMRAVEQNSTNALTALVEQVSREDLFWRDRNKLYVQVHKQPKLINAEFERQMLKLLAHTSPDVAGRAAGYLRLVRVPKPETIQTLIKTAVTRENAELRSAACRALGKATNSSSELGPVLTTLIAEDERLVASSAAIAMGELGAGAQGFWPTFGAMLTHPDEDIRFRAFAALKQIDLGEAALPLCRPWLEKDDWIVATRALGVLRSQRDCRNIAPFVAPLLQYRPVGLAAIQCLRDNRIPLNEFLPDLIEALEQRKENSWGFLELALEYFNRDIKSTLPASYRIECLYRTRKEFQPGSDYQSKKLYRDVKNDWAKLIDQLKAKSSQLAVDEELQRVYEHAPPKTWDADKLFAVSTRFYEGDGILRDRLMGFAFAKLASDRGHLVATASVGVEYYSGQTIPRNYQRAQAYFGRAAAKGHIPAHVNLGHMHFFGMGMEPDHVKARSLYSHQRCSDHGVAQMMLGIMHLEGTGGPKDGEKGLQHLKRAAELGNREAAAMLGDIYRFGLLVKLDNEQSLMYFRQAADKGHAAAQYQVGAACWLGMLGDGKRDSEDNKKLAMSWLRKAALQGHSGAQNDLGRMLIDRGKFPEGFRWLTCSAAQGAVRTAFNMGMFFEKGTGVKKDLIESCKWHSAAARISHRDSKNRLSDLEKQLDEASRAEAERRSRLIRPTKPVFVPTVEQIRKRYFDRNLIEN